MSLRETWDEHADDWIRWARTPGHDSYWRFHGRRFLELVPAPGRLTLDVGGGEGRLGRDLRRHGHRVVEVDGSPAMARAAATHDEPMTVAVGDAAGLPVRAGAADLVVAFMSLQDVDDLDGAIAECARALTVEGWFCLAIVHPINSAGGFEGDRTDSNRPFVVRESYFEERRYADDIERDGLRMLFSSMHRSLETLSRSLERHGLIEALREVTEEDPADKWFRMPLFLHVRAIRRRS